MTGSRKILDLQGLEYYHNKLKQDMSSDHYVLKEELRSEMCKCMPELQYPTEPMLKIIAPDLEGLDIYADNGVIDLSGHDHHGKAYSGVTLLNDEDCLNFDGTRNAYITVNNGIAGFMNGSIDALTLSARIRTTSTDTTKFIIYATRPSGGAAAQLTLAAGKARIGGRTTDSDAFKGINSVESVNDGNWHTITGILRYAEGTLQIYVDGSLSASSTLISAGRFEPFTSLSISNNTDNAFDGQIASIRIYPRALDDIEVETIYMLDSGVNKITNDRLSVSAVRGRTAVGGNDGNYTTRGIKMNMGGDGWFSSKNFLITSTGAVRFNASGRLDGSATQWGGYKIAVVTEMPDDPDANTIYFVEN